MRWVAGIDIGTGFTKAVILTRDKKNGIAGSGIARTGVDFEGAATKALDLARDEAGLPPGTQFYIATTGFGRHRVSFRDIQITEITCAARASAYLFPNADAVLDIGSQSTRAVGVGEKGRVRGFKSNDKCAAGSGSFIQRAAKYLQVPIEEVGKLSRSATNAQPISSVCAVLAESEIINHVSAGVSVEDIMRGIHESLAERSLMLLKRAGGCKELTFIGGVARQEGMIETLAARVGCKVNVPHKPDFACALGAAILCRTRLAKTEKQVAVHA